jgi:class 3 adenylate cyclase
MRFVSRPPSRPDVIPSSRGPFTPLILIGNMLGGLLIWGYFRFVDVAALSNYHGPGELGFFAVSFGLLGAVGLRLGRRWRRPLLEGARAPGGTDEARVRRLALTFPYAMAGLTLAGWILAGVAWGVLWPLLVGEFSLRQALRSILGISAIAGSVATAFIFFSVESLWRRHLPRYFPRGDLSAVRGVPRVGVRARLMAISLLVSVLPLTVLGVLAYTRAGALIGADPTAAAAGLRGLLLFTVFMLVVGGLVAVGLSSFVSRSVSGPLRDVARAMRAVERGDLRAQCPVVGNDEIGAVAEGFNRMVAGLRERELIRETFGKYVTEEVRDEILSGRVDLEGQARDVTILFADIRDFTPWVEAHDPREVVRDLNAYFTLMEGAIREHHGLVLQYIGDEIEAVFGAPVADPNHPDLALRAALEMRCRLAAWNADRARAGRSPLRHGIGIHTGRVLAGSIGSPDRLAWTLVGDPVNVAARLQGLNKDFGSDILLSGETVRRLAAPSGLEPLATAMVKGKATAVEVYRVA